MAKFYFYRNLRTGGFSIKYKGRVVDRIKSAIIDNVAFKVNQKGRERVINERQKNVHAYIVSHKYSIVKNYESNDLSEHEIKYNPYTDSYFKYKNNEIIFAEKVLLSDGKCFKIGK
jgi:hypothetical protein